MYRWTVHTVYTTALPGASLALVCQQNLSVLIYKQGGGVMPSLWFAYVYATVPIHIGHYI